MFAFDSTCKGIGIVKAENVPAIVDEQVKVRQKILTQYAADAGIRRSELSEVLDHREGVWDGMGTCFQPVQIDICAATGSCYATHSGCALEFEPPLGEQGAVNRRDLGSGINDEIVGAGLVDLDGHNN